MDTKGTVTAMPRQTNRYNDFIQPEYLQLHLLVDLLVSPWFTKAQVGSYHTPLAEKISNKANKKIFLRLQVAVICLASAMLDDATPDHFKRARHRCQVNSSPKSVRPPII